MTLYRDTTNGKVWTDSELKESLAEEIDGLGDENSLKQEVDFRGDPAIEDYIIECCLVGIYSRVDNGESTAYRRNRDGQVFYAAEMEDVYVDDTGDLNSEALDRVTFSGWLDDMLRRGVFDAVDGDSVSTG